MTTNAIAQAMSDEDLISSHKERAGDPLSVLLVEDEKVQSMLISALLRKFGHQVHLAYSGEQAIEMFRQVKPDLVLMDVIMPGMDGYQATKAIRAEHKEWVPIIFLSGLSEKNNLLHALKAGGDDFFSKPVDPAVLLAKMSVMGHIHAMQEQLSRNEKEHLLFQAILASSPLAIWMLGNDGKLQFVNSTFCKAVGISEQQFLAASHYADVLPASVSANCIKSDRECFEQDNPHLSVEWLPFVDGKDHLLEITKVKLLDREKSVIGLIGLAVDITERKSAEDRLRLTANVFNNTQEGIVITDVSGNIVEVNDAFSKITGYSREELIGNNPRILQSGQQNAEYYSNMWESIATTRHWTGEVWNRKKNGEIYAAWMTISGIANEDGKITNYVGLSSDITLLKLHERQLQHIAHYDELTGIPNRTLLADRMKQCIAQTSREKNMAAVCYLDLDEFKRINDTMGHETGDRVLIEIAKRILNTIRGGDTVARLGGDEFVVLLLGLDKGEECVSTLGRLLAAIGNPIIINDKSYTVSASIGVSLFPLDDADPDTLLRHADQAMYVAKQSGKNRFHIYDPSLDRNARDQHEFLKSIRYGLEHDQFVLYYQPKINLHSKELVGAEALIRWQHPERGLLSPAEFLRHIENTELDIMIGEWVTATALAQINSWQESGLNIEISINISGYHLESPLFVERLQQQFALYPRIPFGKLQIEVLETVALNEIAIVREVIESCRKFGVGFALDDFGTGYSSLSYLSSLPVDVLKIDQSFVRDMLTDKGDRAIVQGIIALAHAFDRQTVAEGVETENHYRVLLDMGCELGQGYGIARPMPPDMLMNWRAA